MKAHPAVGDFYRQEFSLGNAEDYGETLSLNTSVTSHMARSTTASNRKRRLPWNLISSRINSTPQASGVSWRSMKTPAKGRS